MRVLAVTASDDHAGVNQDSHVVRERGRAAVYTLDDPARAHLAVPQHREHLQARLVAERLEHRRLRREVVHVALPSKSFELIMGPPHGIVKRQFEIVRIVTDLVTQSDTASQGTKVETLGGSSLWSQSSSRA